MAIIMNLINTPAHHLTLEPILSPQLCPSKGHAHTRTRMHMHTHLCALPEKDGRGQAR